MPLNAKAITLLDQLSQADENFTLFGLAINPATGEMGTFCSSPFEPGQILGFLHEGVLAMTEAAKNGELEGVTDGEHIESGEGAENVTLVN